jgi:hypothetical protein
MFIVLWLGTILCKEFVSDIQTETRENFSIISARLTTNQQIYVSNNLAFCEYNYIFHVT